MNNDTLTEIKIINMKSSNISMTNEISNKEDFKL